MSNWSHVAAIIRIDDMQFFNQEVPNFEEIMGKTMDYEDLPCYDYEYREEDFLPMGSEGSLKMTVWVNPDKSHISSYTISIFGDLRDHDSTSKIIDWFKGKCKLIDEKFMGIRNACITVRNEWYGTETWAM